MSEFMLKRRLNPVLLVSTLAALSLLAGLSVISQDQINERQDKVQQLEQDKNSLNQTVNRLNSEINNKSVKITQLNQNNTRLRNEKINLEKNLSERNEEKQKLSQRVGTLSENLQDAKSKIPELNVTELNNSIQEICEVDWNESIDEQEDAEEECEEWRLSS